MTGAPVNAARTPSPIVHVVDDDEAVRKATERLLSAAGFTVRTHGSADAFLSAFEADTAGCIVLDVRMPGPSGTELQTILAGRDDRIPIIFLTGHAEVPASVRAIQRGAIDYLIKPVDATVLIDAVSRALARDSADRAARANRRALQVRYERLTPREREVFAHLIGGQINKQVAADLNITERTIKLHRARIFERLEVDSMAGLVRLAIDLGIAPASVEP
jgi:FixJ family two-component response regulator